MDDPEGDQARKPKARKKAAPKADLPVLMTHREVAKHFGVTTEGLRKWVHRGEFPEPHSMISQTWFYRADLIEHRLRTGRWLQGVTFRGRSRPA